MGKIFTFFFRWAMPAILVMAGICTRAQAQTYCDPFTYGGSWEHITNVTYGGINNSTSYNSATTGAEDYTALGPASVTQGVASNISVTIFVDASEYIYAFIDWNQNGVLNDAGEVYTIASGVNTTGPHILSITPPVTAIPGNTRMRVMVAYTVSVPDPCLNGYSGEAEDYTVNVIAGANCSTVTGFPTSATAGAFPNSLCVTGNVNLSFTPATPMPGAGGVTYQWQSGPTATGPWTNIGTAGITPNYTATISATSYFRCQVLCNGTTVLLNSSASPVVTVNNPGNPTGTPGSRCGPGTVNLSATGPAGTTLRWYANATGGAPLAMGTNFTTPYIPATTNFYVTAGTAPAPSDATIGAGALVPNWDYVTMFSGGWGGYKHQYLIRESEMIAAGILPGSPINSITVFNDNGTSTYNGFTLSLKNTTTMALTTTMEAGAVPAFGPSNYTTTIGQNTFTLTTPFMYTGGSLLIQTCWSNGNSSNTFSNVRFDNTSYNATHYDYDDLQTPAFICAGPTYTGSATQQRPQFKFNYDASCQSPRIPVLATVTAPPVLTRTAPNVLCNDAVGQISITSPAGNYSNYSWTPAADLYTNAAATTPYVAGSSATTIYFKSDVAGAKERYLYATNSAAPNCAFSDTVRMWVQPGDVTIKAVPDTICVAGTSTLSLIPGADYAAGSIQWQESADGITYTNIAGANGVTYTTNTINTNTYYKAIIASDNPAQPCETPVKQVIIANPQIVSFKDSVHCGPGVVTLEAVNDGTSNVLWYESPTSLIPVGSGTPWNTPYLGATTTFYVASSSGTPQPSPDTIGNGTWYSTWFDVPYALGWYDYLNNKAQWVITAAEMQASGFNPGFIESIGFEVGSAGDAVENMTLKMKAIAGTTIAPPFETGMQTVFSTALYQPVSNMINEHVLQTPFYWDGTSSIVIEECHENSNYGMSSEVKYNSNGSGMYNYSDNTNHCANPTSTTWNAWGSRPDVFVKMKGACESNREAVTAYIRPVPDVDLGLDVNVCTEPGHVEVLDAGVQLNSTYLWDNGATAQIRAVNATGNYYVTVTNEYNCAGSDSIHVMLRKNPQVELGNDTTVCNGVTITLDAGNDGIDYFWNTGQVTQTINVSSANKYNVFVTNAEGCVKTDTIEVIMQGELPTIQGIQISNNGQHTFTFAALYPQNVIGYDWDFGDGTPHSYQANPTHTYANDGDYIVVLNLSSTCGFYTDSTSAHIVGIHQLDIDQSEMMIYPNPTRESATILNSGSLKMEKVSIYNLLGQVVYSATADSKDKHNLKLTSLASGVYTVEIFTDKGNVSRKLEVIK